MRFECGLLDKMARTNHWDNWQMLRIRTPHSSELLYVCADDGIPLLSDNVIRSFLII